MPEKNRNAVLQYAVDNEIINLAYVQEQVEMKKREELLKCHPYKIWDGKDGKWHTYLPDADKGRVPRKRNTKTEIEKVVIDYWKEMVENPTIQEVFTEWNDRRMSIGKIQKSTHLRNQQIFDRHYKEFGKKRIKNIFPEQIEEFLEEQIYECNLTAKAFSNLKGITKGLLKRAKKRKLIDFNVGELFLELDVSETDFRKNIKRDEEEVFNDEEMSAVITYLEKEEHDLLALGILLMFVTGIRVGELSTLKWSDWDGCSLRIQRTETRYKEEGGKYVYEIKETPKTPAGNRNAVVPPHCLWIIKEIRKENPFGEYMFEKDGNRIKTYSFRKKLYRTCRNTDVLKKSPHKIRKTYGSILMDNHVADKNVIELMGHTDIQCTRQFYSRNRKTNKGKAELLDKIPEFRIGNM